MTDISTMNQAQFAIQNAQTQAKLDKMNQTAKNAEGGFAQALSAQQMQDPSFKDAMAKRKIKETAVEFEAQFLSTMLQPMFEGLDVEEPFGGGHAEKMWQSMLVNEYGKAIAKNGGIGLADQVQKQLLRTQEGF